MASVGASVLCPSWLGAADHDAWSIWKEHFLLPEGRVVDDGAGGISHSEGQGYGLLLAQAFGDRPAFERMEAWTRANLLVRDESLMAWRWEPGRGVTDWRSATDGDLFRAWALLRAARDSGWPVADAAEIAHDIAALCLAPDPRAPGEVLLLPGAEAAYGPGRVPVNPSYIMGRALRELGEAANRPELLRAADHGETLLADLAAVGFVPDWIDVTVQGFAPPAEHDLRAGYDALRVPLFLVWSGRADHPAVARGIEALRLPHDPGRTVVRRRGDGQPDAFSDLPGYQAILALARCAEVLVSAEDVVRQSYYPATLQLLAIVAHHESNHCANPLQRVPAPLMAPN